MDNHKISDETREKYEDAVVSVFMDQYAAALEAGIDKEMEQCEDSDFPPELEKRCLELIQKERAKKKWKVLSKKSLSILRSAAAVVVVLLSVCSVLFITVEAFRLPIMNFFVEETDHYWQLSGKPDTDKIPENFNPEDPLDGIIPDEFVLTELTGSWETGYLTAEYSNGELVTINFSMSAHSDNVQIDTEKASIIKCKIFSHEALKSVKDNFVRVSWKDEQNDRIFTLCAVNVTAEMVEDYAEAVAMCVD